MVIGGVMSGYIDDKHHTILIFEKPERTDCFYQDGYPFFPLRGSGNVVSGATTGKIVNKLTLFGKVDIQVQLGWTLLHYLQANTFL